MEELLSSSAVDVCDVSALSAAELLVGWLEGVVRSTTNGMYSGVAGAVRHMLLSVLSCKVHQPEKIVLIFNLGL